MSEEIKFTVNGTELEAKSGELLIEACENSGIHIPRFCWHKRLEPVGMCRMCLVEVETPRGKALVPSCTTEITEDLVVDTESEVVKKAQEGKLITIDEICRFWQIWVLLWGPLGSILASKIRLFSRSDF